MPADTPAQPAQPDQPSRSVLLITPGGDVIVDENGRPAVVAVDAEPRPVVRVDATTWATRLTAEEEESLLIDGTFHLANARDLLHDRRVARALALVNHRDHLRFDPVDGSELGFDEDGVIARRSAGGLIFPRIDPAVIGLVSLSGTDRILLGRNRRHAFFSLVAGYVDSGENLEEAFAREVLEETGRRIGPTAYWGSQPWPVSGSIMVGFTAQTTDEDAVQPTDGELSEIIWASPVDLHDLPLAGPGSIAHAILDDWMVKQTGEGLKKQ